MLHRSVFFGLLFSLVFASCQKQDVIGSRDYQTLGTSAHQILTASPYSLLKIEIQYMPGFAPDSASVARLIDFLNTCANKPGGIQVVLQQIAPSGKAILSIDEIVSIEKKNRTAFTENNRLAVHILITDGKYNSPDILATSYWNTSICVFGKTVQDNLGTTGSLEKSKLLATLFEHEFGHLMGLVNQGSPMQTSHKDPSHGAHCINPECLMYYDVEKSWTGGVVFNIPTLDADCQADLKANGGK